MRLKKTATELKHDQLFRNYQKAKNKGKKSKPKNKGKKKSYFSASALKQMSYADFLSTNYWKRCREAVLKRDGYKCVICKSETELQIHHDSYKNHGDELRHLEDLLTLCRNCHKEHHYAQNQPLIQ